MIAFAVLLILTLLERKLKIGRVELLILGVVGQAY